MDTGTIFAITTISVGIVYLVLNNWILNIKNKSIAKGYESGQKEVLRSLKSTAYWFSSPIYQKEYNSLMLYSIIYEKYGSVDSDLFRKRIEELGDRKLSELSKNEIYNLIR